MPLYDKDVFAFKKNSIANFLLISGFIFLLSEVLGGVIRYYLFNFNLTILGYLPKILLVISMFLVIFKKLARGKLSKPYLVILLILIFSVLVAIFNIRNFQQIAFGVWLLIPFLYGILVAPVILNSWEKLGKYMFVLWIIAVIGVFINLFYKWPWIGFNYEIGNITVEGTREWFTGGFERLAGFSRISAAAASQILLSGLMLVLSSENTFFKTFVWLLSGIAILLTTTKTTLGIWFVLTFFLVFSDFFGLKLLKPLPVLFVLIIIIFPFSTLITDYKLNVNNFYTYLLLASFEERLTFTWPWTINMILNCGSLILGRGIGGIGASQRYFESQLYSPADNLALYLFGLFGIFGIIILLIIGLTIALKVNNTKRGKFIFFLSIACFLEGLTLSVIEEPFFAICLGIAFSFAFSKMRIRSFTHQPGVSK